MINIHDVLAAKDYFTTDEIKGTIEKICRLEFEYMQIQIEKGRGEIRKPQAMQPSSVKMMEKKVR